MATQEAAPAQAKPAPNLTSLFPTKKKGFKGTNLSGGQKEGTKKKAAEKDEWGEEEVVNAANLRVGVQVESLNTGEEVEAEKPTWNVKAAEAEEENTGTKQYPSLARSVQPGKQESSGPSAPAKVEGISGDRSKFDVLKQEEEEAEEPQTSAGPSSDEAAKKAAKKEAKRLEKERREKEAAAEQAKREKTARVVMVNGVEDTKIRPDMDAIQAKYDGRRKRAVREIES